MSQPAQIPGLAELRMQIDALDAQLLELLNQRAELSLAVGKAKISAGNASVYDPAREAQLLASLAQRNPGPLSSSHIEAVWREIMAASRDLQTQMRANDTGQTG